MYINPFLAGVLTTIGVEILASFIFAVVAAMRNMKHGD